MRCMRPLVLAVLFLSAATSLSAFEIFPSAPDSHTYVRIVAVVGSCAPTTTVAVSGSTITVDVGMLPGFACIPESTALATANLGVLPAGVYQVVIRWKNDLREIEKGTLVVRDAGAGILVSP